MLLGKRPRPPMKRTMSMKDVAVDFGAAEAVPPPTDQELLVAVGGNQLQQRQQQGMTMPWGRGDLETDRRRNVAASSALSAMVSTRRSSADFAAVETAPFLRACALCKGRLLPGRDIFMYRGEIAFCSSECREQQINQDERKEKAKCSVSSAKKDSSAQANATASEASNVGETMAAA